MKQIYNILFSGIALLLCIGCASTNNPSDGTSKEDVKTVLSGRIVDESGSAVASATVTCGTKSATTDASGIFKISGIKDNSGNIVVSAKKAGYFDAFRRMVKSEKGATNISLAMRAKQKIAQFSATNGITAQLGDGASVSIPANGIKVESTGAPYTGQIDLYAYNLDPAQDSYADYFPGDFTARDTADKETSLFSHGINRVELFSPSGEKLNLRTGATARMIYPIPQALTGQAPASIPIWHFDEFTGLWKETEIAQLLGSSYVVEVKHFSTVNLDVRSPSCIVIVTVVDCKNNPVAGATVSLGSGQGVTDQTGSYTFRNVPVEMIRGISSTQTVRASSLLNGMMQSKSVSLSNLQAGETRRVTIMMESSSLSGRLVDCNSNPTTGMVKAEWANGGFSSAYADGNFTIPVPASTTVNITAAGKSLSVTIPAGCDPYTVGDIKIDPTGKDCQQGGGTCSLIWTFNGQTYNANDYKYQGQVPCGGFTQSIGLSIRGLISTDPGQGLSLSAQNITGTGTYTIGQPYPTQNASVLFLPADGSSHYASCNVKDKSNSPTGTLTIESFTSTEVRGRFTCTMYEGGGNESGTATLTGSFTVPRF